MCDSITNLCKQAPVVPRLDLQQALAPNGTKAKPSARAHLASDALLESMIEVHALK